MRIKLNGVDITAASSVITADDELDIPESVDDVAMDIDEESDDDISYEDAESGLDDRLDDLEDDIDEMQDSLDDIEEDEVQIEIDNNLDGHYIAECDKCKGIFISAVVESDAPIESIRGVCPLCDKESDQFLKWIIRSV